MTVMVPILLGDGTGEIKVEVMYWAQYLRGPDNNCAYCHADPCGELGLNSDIAKYLARNEYAETCPVCSGRPT